jgi:hypothetical protein
MSLKSTPQIFQIKRFFVGFVVWLSDITRIHHLSCNRAPWL